MVTEPLDRVMDVDDDRHDDDDDDVVAGLAWSGDDALDLAGQIAALPLADRHLMTSEVIQRWTEGLAPSDVISAKRIVQLERRRRRTLVTLRDGINLTDLEFKCWRLLQRHEGRTVTQAELIRHLWLRDSTRVPEKRLWERNGPYDRHLRHLQNVISNLRRKIERDHLRPQHIVSIRSVGYRWYSQPPSWDDGEDYGARADEASRLRYQIRGYRGELPPSRDRVGRFTPGPEHPDYRAIEGDVTERSSRPEGRRG